MLYIPTIRIKPLSVFSDFSSHLTERYFYATVGVALLLHVVAFGIYALMPHEEVMQIPVKALNIKLGGGGAEAEPATNIASPPPNQIQYAGVPNSLPENTAAETLLDNVLNTNPLAAKNDLPQKPRNISSDTMKKANAMPSEFVRQGQVAGAPAGEGSPDSDGGEEMMRRYEQVLSLWIERHKVYPAEARAQGMEGEAVIRIRINREGQIIQSRLEKGTRYQLLNEAIEDMVRAASPVPAVPSNYPAGDRFEFLIPVSFRLQ